MGPCYYGKEDPETGACKYLYFVNDLAVCPFIRQGEAKVMEKVEFGRGCVMRGKANIEEYLNEKVNTFRRYKNI